MNLGIIHAAKSFVRPVAMKGLLAVAAAGALPTAAMAHPHFGFDDVRIDLHAGPVVVAGSIAPPVCDPREVRVWVEPVYRTAVDHQWVEATYRTVDDRTCVPDRFEVRDVVHIDRHGRRFVSRERVLVEAAHDIVTQRQVLVCDGHYEDVERQVLVTPGHFETHVETVAITR